MTYTIIVTLAFMVLCDIVLVLTEYLGAKWEEQKDGKI